MASVLALWPSLISHINGLHCLLLKNLLDLPVLVSLFVVSMTVGSSEHTELLLSVFLFVVSRAVVSSEHTELLLLVSLFVVSTTVGSSEHNELLLLVSLWFPRLGGIVNILNCSFQFLCLWFPGLWGVVNNAGVWYFSEVEMTSEKVFRHVMDVNLFGAVNVTKSVLPLIRKAKGRVINVSSLLGELWFASCAD